MHGGSATDGGISRGKSKDLNQGVVWSFRSVPGMGRAVRNLPCPAPRLSCVRRACLFFSFSAPAKGGLVGNIRAFSCAQSVTRRHV